MSDAGGQMPDGRLFETTAEVWMLVRSGAGEPAFNMAMDEALLEAAPALGRPTLRFYSWQRAAATFGYSQRYSEVQELTPLRPLIRRPTGGGVVPHDGDWTYTLVFPPLHGWYALRARESYERLHRWLQASFERLGVRTELAPTAAAGAPTHCFMRAEQHDVLHRGAKVAGAAQRRTKTGLLIQGSVQPPRGLARADWEAEFCALATERWQVAWLDFPAYEALKRRASALAAGKYSQDAHNRRR